MTISSNLAALNAKIEIACQQAGRPTKAVRLMAVSKTRGAEEVREAILAGQRLFGENRVIEAKTKFSPLREEFPDLELHLIGPLQTNKALEAVKLFDVVETLDRPKLADELARAQTKTNRNLTCYIEVNIGEEPQKAGIFPQKLGEFLGYCVKKRELRIGGLMCMPPRNADPVPYFLKLRELAIRHNLPHLSMGMSGDFEQAIRCGATEVRIGTALFGERSVQRP
ncbi:MAG: YggS family pyridoxal phosphate-dependent enzyme [Bdellovibrionales bacterium]